MTDPDGDGEYTVTMLLPVGAYQYKFVVGTSGWTQDKAGQDDETDDGFGGKNSIRNVDERFPAIAVKQGDGQVFPDGVQHTQGAGELNPAGRLARAVHRARAPRRRRRRSISCTWPGGRETVTPMRAINTDKVYEYFRAELSRCPSTDLRVPLPRRREGAVARAAGIRRDGRGALHFRPREASRPSRPRTGSRTAIIYQIFPDRFRNGNKANDPRLQRVVLRGQDARSRRAAGSTSTTRSTTTSSRTGTTTRVLDRAPPTRRTSRDWMAFYGGDIAGVRAEARLPQDARASRSSTSTRSSRPSPRTSTTPRTTARSTRTSARTRSSSRS